MPLKNKRYLSFMLKSRKETAILEAGADAMSATCLIVRITVRAHNLLKDVQKCVSMLGFGEDEASGARPVHHVVESIIKVSSVLSTHGWVLAVLRAENIRQSVEC